MRSTLISTMSAPSSEAARAMLVARADGGRAPARRRGWAGPRRLALTAALAATAVVVVSLSLAGGPSAAPAYATWTAVPLTAPQADPPSSKVREWSSVCTDLGVGGVRVGGLDPAAASHRRPVLVDRRGSFTYCVDVATGGGTESDPLIALGGLRSDGGPSRGLGGAWVNVSSEPYRSPGAGSVLVLGGDLSTVSPLDPAEREGVRSLEFYQLFGTVGTDVQDVDVVLTNGLRVTATVQAGVWGAWWPSDKGDPTGVRLAITTGDGAASEVAAADVQLDQP